MIPSELLEPVLAQCISWALDDFRASSMGSEDRLRLREAIKTLDRVAICNRGEKADSSTGVYASLSLRNWRSQVETLMDAMDAAARKPEDAKDA